MHVYTKSHISGFNNDSEMPLVRLTKNQTSVDDRSAALLLHVHVIRSFWLCLIYMWASYDEHLRRYGRHKKTYVTYS